MVKGANIFKGYFLNSTQTTSALDNDGWYHTGDIGAFDELGQINIIDRINNIFKISQGDYIAPEKIENVYLRCPFISQIFIYGSSLKNCLVAIIVPEEKAMETWCRQNNLTFNFKDICKNQIFKDKIMQISKEIANEENLNNLEQIKDIYIHDDLFSVENNLLTATMKLKRTELARYFAAHINQMYINIE